MHTELPGYCNKGTPVPQALRHGLTEVTELPGWGMRFLQNFQNIRVRERLSYTSSNSSGYCGTEGRTSGTAATGVQNFFKFRVRV